MHFNPYSIVSQFEEEVARYTGSKFAISVDSCTNALLLCCEYLRVKEVTIPSNTYVSVPLSIIHSGGWVNFIDVPWSGIYQLAPYPIYDCAKRFTKNMYVPNTYMCLSFHAKKILKIGRGGMILTDNINCVDWFKKARFDGRDQVPLSEQLEFDVLGHNCYMLPEQAALGLRLLSLLPEENEDLPRENYLDLRKHPLFSSRKYYE